MNCITLPFLILTTITLTSSVTLCPNREHIVWTHGQIVIGNHTDDVIINGNGNVFYYRSRYLFDTPRVGFLTLSNSLMYYSGDLDTYLFYIQPAKEVCETVVFFKDKSYEENVTKCYTPRVTLTNFTFRGLRNAGQ